MLFLAIYVYFAVKNEQPNDSQDGSLKCTGGSERCLLSIGIYESTFKYLF